MVLPEDNGAKKLQLKVSVEGGKTVTVHPTGEPVRIRSDNFEGSIYFVHRPSKGSQVPVARASRLDAKAAIPPLLWEVQVQGRFLAKPRGTLWMRGELREQPMKMGPVMRGFAQIVLKFLKYQAQNRGYDLGYSFGAQEKGALKEFPSLAVPVQLVDRIFVSDTPLPLPLGEDSMPEGTWRMVDNQWEPIDRSSIEYNSSTYVTWAFATAYFDWLGWKLSSLPGVDTIPLSRFWGSQGCWIGLADEEPNGSARRWFLEVSARVVDIADADTEDDLPEVVPEVVSSL